MVSLCKRFSMQNHPRRPALARASLPARERSHFLKTPPKAAVIVQPTHMTPTDGLVDRAHLSTRSPIPTVSHHTPAVNHPTTSILADTQPLPMQPTATRSPRTGSAPPNCRPARRPTLQPPLTPSHAACRHPQPSATEPPLSLPPTASPPTASIASPTAAPNPLHPSKPALKPPLLWDPTR